MRAYLIIQIMSGRIELMYGPMFSQKTMWLVHICLGKMADLGKKCLLILHEKDIRPGLMAADTFSTHTSTLRRKHEKINTLRVNNLCDIDVSAYDYIGVDEGQFFDKDSMKAIIQWFTMGKIIYVSALDGDSERNFFGYTYLLIPYVQAGCLHKSNASVCMRCLDQNKNSVASFTHKHALTSSGGQGSQIDPGADDKYMSVCTLCYEELH